VNTCVVEILYFDGCPNVATTRGLVEEVAAEAGVAPEIHEVEVTSADAGRRRFLGSPSLRVDGHDVEPGADDRDLFVFGCRIYRTEDGVSGQPARAWVHAALRSRIEMKGPVP
jgi:hypothetical protein